MKDHRKKIEMRTPDKVEMIQVIYTRAVRGDGTEENPVRQVHQYWDFEGHLLAEKEGHQFQTPLPLKKLKRGEIYE